MKLSIVIPFYNADALIGRMLESLMDQGLEASDYEIIIVDDESPQEVVAAKEYAARFPQISYHRIPHGGQGLARNYGLSAAKGEWIYFCDADDFLQPQALGGMIRVAEERGLQMILADMVVLYPNDPVPPHPKRNFDKVSATMTGMEYLGDPTNVFSWSPCVYLVKHAFLVDNGLKFESIAYVEDRFFRLALLEKIERCATVEVDLYYYIQNDISVLHSSKRANGPKYIECFFVYIDRLNSYIDKPTIPPKAVERLKRYRQRAAYVLLLNAFLYCPVDVTKSSISRLKALGLYPVGYDRHKGSRRTRFLRRIMDRPRLWTAFYRLVHLFPDSFIQKHFKINR